MVVHAGAGAVPHALDVFHTEVLGCRAGVQEAADRGMSMVVAETDSMLLKLAMEGNEFSLATVGGLVHEIKAVANASFSSFCMSFCSRVCNSVAHELASRGCMCSPSTNLSWDGVPTGMESLVAGDLVEPIS